MHEYRIRKNLVGKTFNKLTVLKLHSTKPVKYLCSCRCGNTCVVLSGHITTNHTKSCGCQKIESAKKQNFKDLTGQRFGRLLVIERGTNYKSGARWLVQCDCGSAPHLVQSNGLLDGTVTSCGCYRLEQLRKAITTHGMSKTPEYRRLQATKRREMSLLLDTEWTLDKGIAIRNYQGACVICGKTQEENIRDSGESLHLDHVFPLNKGGGLKPGNATILCSFHNLSKQDKLVSELPVENAFKILHSAEHFRCHWNLEIDVPAYLRIEL